MAYEGHTSDPRSQHLCGGGALGNRDDLNSHGRAPHMKVWREYSAQLKTSPTVIEIITADKVDSFMADQLKHDQSNAGSGTVPAGPKRAADTVVLDFDDRHRRRMAMTGTRGLEFLLDLENAVALARRRCAGAGRRPADRGGGGAPSRCSRSAAPIRRHLVRRRLASRQPPSADADHGQGPAHPPRSRHRGNGEGLGARVIEIEAPFDPEGGAYAAAHGAHDHGHGHRAMIMITITITIINTTTTRIIMVMTIITMMITITMTSIATTEHHHGDTHAHDHK